MKWSINLLMILCFTVIFSSVSYSECYEFACRDIGTRIRTLNNNPDYYDSGPLSWDGSYVLKLCECEECPGPRATYTAYILSGVSWIYLGSFQVTSTQSEISTLDGAFTFNNSRLVLKYHLRAYISSEQIIDGWWIQFENVNVYPASSDPRWIICNGTTVPDSGMNENIDPKLLSEDPTSFSMNDEERDSWTFYAKDCGVRYRNISNNPDVYTGVNSSVYSPYTLKLVRIPYYAAYTYMAFILEGEWRYMGSYLLVDFGYNYQVLDGSLLYNYANCRLLIKSRITANFTNSQIISGWWIQLENVQNNIGTSDPSWLIWNGTTVNQ